MQAGKACRLEDDMVDGDLGDGTAAAPSSAGKKNQRWTGPSDRVAGRGGAAVESVWSSGAGLSRWTVPGLGEDPTRLGSLADVSKEDLKKRLQEAAAVIDALRCELDVTHRYLEGKYEALKILQGKAILDKATTHNRTLLLKSDDKARSLEKEVNRLQWELSFQQVHMKTTQQDWEQKYSRVVSENRTLTDSLVGTKREIQQLRAESAALRRQHLELVSLLSVKEQRVYQETKPASSPESGSSALELAVLGACQCVRVSEACPCSQSAAAGRKQLVELQEERDTLLLRREEALRVADAFRIAFEQQLKKKSEHTLLLLESSVLRACRCGAEGVNRSPLIAVRQKLRRLLPSSGETKRPEELLLALYKLLDLLNDKEEALAHQRKVSIMLAHSAVELHKQRHPDTPCRPSDCSEDTVQSDQPQRHDTVQSDQPQDPDIVQSDQPQDPDIVQSDQPQDPDIVQSDQPQRPDIVQSDQPQDPDTVQSDQPQRHDTVQSDQPQRPDTVQSDQPQDPDTVQSDQPQDPDIVQSDQPQRPDIVQSDQPQDPDMVQSDPDAGLRVQP